MGKLWVAFVFVIALARPIMAQEQSQEIAEVGDYMQFLTPVSGLLLTGLYKDEEGARQLLESSAVSMFITHGLKRIISSERPNGGPHSFPSGHTAFAFVGSTFIHERYGWKWGIPAHSAAAFVGYSRIVSKNHRTVDVMAGAAIGIGSSLVFTNPHTGRFSIEPIFGYRRGLSMTIHF